MKTTALLLLCALPVSAQEINFTNKVVTFTNLEGRVYTQVTLIKGDMDGLFWNDKKGSGGRIDYTNLDGRFLAKLGIPPDRIEAARDRVLCALSLSAQTIVFTNRVASFTNLQGRAYTQVTLVKGDLDGLVWRDEMGGGGRVCYTNLDSALLESIGVPTNRVELAGFRINQRRQQQEQQAKLAAQAHDAALMQAANDIEEHPARVTYSLVTEDGDLNFIAVAHNRTGRRITVKFSFDTFDRNGVQMQSRSTESPRVEPLGDGRLECSFWHGVSSVKITAAKVIKYGADGEEMPGTFTPLVERHE